MRKLPGIRHNKQKARSDSWVKLNKIQVLRMAKKIQITILKNSSTRMGVTGSCFIKTLRGECGRLNEII
jgi:hypothetical protein